MGSYILDNRKEKLVLYILKEINNRTYFRCASLRKQFINQFRINSDLSQSISRRIGRIMKELIELGVLEREKGRYKNLFKGMLFETMNKRMDENYTMIQMKAEI